MRPIRSPKPGYGLAPLLLVLWAGCSQRMGVSGDAIEGTPAPATAPLRDLQSMELCPDPHGPVVAITAQMIAYLPLDSSLKSLRARCPAARDTVYRGIEGHPSPAILFPFHELMALAVQHRLLLSLDRAADIWIVSGRSGTLPSDLPLAATWNQLTRAYGRAVGTTDIGRVIVTFCSLPNFSFVLDADPVLVGSPEVSGDLSRIPGDARIIDVDIVPSSASPPTGPC